MNELTFVLDEQVLTTLKVVSKVCAYLVVTFSGYLIAYQLFTFPSKLIEYRTYSKKIKWNQSSSDFPVRMVDLQEKMIKSILKIIGLFITAQLAILMAGI